MLPGVSGPVTAEWLQPLTGERATTCVDVAPRLALSPPSKSAYVVRLRPAPVQDAAIRASAPRAAVAAGS